MTRMVVAGLLGTVVGFCLPVPAFAQCNPPEQIDDCLAFRGLVQFDLAPPGARSLGMGGTFVAIADDATAAEANPAGLTILPVPEISGHIQITRSDNPSLEDGTLVTFPQTVFNPGFFSFVYPLGSGAFSVYYQQPLNMQTRESAADGSTLDVDAVVRTIGFSGAYRIGDYVSVGASLRVETSRWDAAQFTPGVLGVGLFDQRIVVDGSDTAVSANIGVLVNQGGTVAAGFVYKKGGDFAVPAQQELFFFGNPVGSVDTELLFSIPDVYSGGIAGRVGELVLGLDLAHIRYSDLDTISVVGSPAVELRENATEVHVGAEYTIVRGVNQFHLRGGVFTDGDHDGIADLDTAQTHVTFGAGVSMRSDFQIDAAVAIAEFVSRFNLSAVYSF